MAAVCILADVIEQKGYGSCVAAVRVSAVRYDRRVLYKLTIDKYNQEDDPQPDVRRKPQSYIHSGLRVISQVNERP